jgi:DNA-binding MarR family transcriptional regulator
VAKSGKRNRERHATDLAEALNRVVTHLVRRLRRIDDRQPIGRARLSALSVLVFGGPRTLSQLADDEGVTPATMHHVVQGLLDSGLAQKKPNATDRRTSSIEVSAKGRTLMLKARAARLAMLDEGLRDLSAEDRECLRRSIEILARWER